MTRAASKKQGKEKSKPAKKLKLNKKTIRDLDSAGEVKGGSQGSTYRVCAPLFATGGC
jgi:hypothetical protein